MILQPGRPRNVPEALMGPEDKKNSLRAEKEKAGEPAFSEMYPFFIL